MDKKQEIIEAAFELFCEKGYHLSMSELSAAVKIKTPSLYSHFESKDQILEIMIREEIERFYVRLEEKMSAAKEMSCERAMRSLYKFVMSYFGDYKRLRFWRIIPLIENEKLSTTFSKLIAEKDDEFSREMSLCFLKGQERGEIRRDANISSLLLYLCTIQGVLDGMLMYKKEPGETAFSDKVFEAYWEGISAKTAARKG